MAPCAQSSCLLPHRGCQLPSPSQLDAAGEGVKGSFMITPKCVCQHHCLGIAPLLHGKMAFSLFLFLINSSELPGQWAAAELTEVISVLPRPLKGVG